MSLTRAQLTGLAGTTAGIAQTTANSAQATATNANTTATTIATKFQNFVSITDFGAVGDGVTNDASAIQQALNTGRDVFVPPGEYLYSSNLTFQATGQTLFGNGSTSILKSGPGSVYIRMSGNGSSYEEATISDLNIRDLKIRGFSNGGCLLISHLSGANFSRVHFHGGQQRVWLFSASNVTVNDCVFEETGYGVIQQLGYASNHVSVNGCRAINMLSDFVEANCTSLAPSFYWSITNNVFVNNKSYETGGGIEDRFVGITGVEGILINGNVVTKVGGDAAIHLEDIGGECIVSDNVFDNCLCTGGNNGYIYLLNSAENTVIADNIFLRSDTSLPSAFAVDAGSGAYSNRVVFTGNRVVGNPGDSSNMSGLNLAFNGGSHLISNNQFEGLRVGVRHVSSGGFQINGNAFFKCTQGIINGLGGGGGGTGFHVANNVFSQSDQAGSGDDMGGRFNLRGTNNSSGTQGPKDWTVIGNKFDAICQVSGTTFAPGPQTGAAEDINIMNNVFADTASLVTGGSMHRSNINGNVFQNDGSSTFFGSKLQSSGQIIANTSVVRGYNGTGSITVTIDGLATAQGNAYRRASALVTVTGRAGNATGNVNNVFYVTFDALSAYSGSVTDIVGTASGSNPEVTFGNSNSNGCTMTFTQDNGGGQQSNLSMTVILNANSASATLS